MPNNLNIHSYRSFSRYGITITFFAIQLSKLVLVKTLLLLDCIENLCYEEIVWRQLELAFFGAVTPVAALFIFINICRGVYQNGKQKSCSFLTYLFPWMDRKHHYQSFRVKTRGIYLQNTRLYFSHNSNVWNLWTGSIYMQSFF